MMTGMQPVDLESNGMRRKLTFTNGKIMNGAVGISFSSQSEGEIHMSDVIIDGCNTAILERDPVGAIAGLGIPPEVPREDIRLVIEEILQSNAQTAAEKESVVKRSKFWSLIQNASNATVIVQGLVALTPPALASFLAQL
ncbi:hypothetical protein CXB37_04120 [Pseudomonas syringae pv. syringae]|nr:hypothetical protein CXB37_04120 [Pseudomonas syringae pv. syringae]